LSNILLQINRIEMDEQSRLKLNEMIKENNVTDQTELIRELKHSSIIRNETKRLLEILEENPTSSFSELRDISMMDCNFMFSYYTDIYNRLLKGELEVSLLYKFLDILETIEKGEANQHEASFKVGSILKEIYVDSALKKAQKLEKENELREKEKETERTPAKEPMKLSWRSYKIQTNKRIAELNDTHDMEMVD
jgi:hypothetical protein